MKFLTKFQAKNLGLFFTAPICSFQKARFL